MYDLLGCDGLDEGKIVAKRQIPDLHVAYYLRQSSMLQQLTKLLCQHTAHPSYETSVMVLLLDTKNYTITDL